VEQLYSLTNNQSVTKIKKMTETEKEPRFKNFSELVNDEFFIEIMKTHADKLLRDRRNRNPPPKGFRYRRDWYDTMKTQIGHLNSTFFLENILDIWHKSSNLSSKTRSVIEYVGNKSMNDTIKHYEKLDNKQDTHE